jgi:hypothetical protein
MSVEDDFGISVSLSNSKRKELEEGDLCSDIFDDDPLAGVQVNSNTKAPAELSNDKPKTRAKKPRGAKVRLSSCLRHPNAFEFSTFVAPIPASPQLLMIKLLRTIASNLRQSVNALLKLQ